MEERCLGVHFQACVRTQQSKFKYLGPSVAARDRDAAKVLTVVVRSSCCVTRHGQKLIDPQALGLLSTREPEDHKWTCAAPRRDSSGPIIWKTLLGQWVFL